MAESAFFSTRGLPVGTQFKAWRERLRETIGDVSASAPAHEDFAAWTCGISDRDVGLFRISVDPQFIEKRAHGLLSPGSPVHVVFPLAGQFHMEQAGRSVVLEPGDWGLYDPALSFRSATERTVEFLVVAAPRATILGRRIGFENCCARRFSAGAGSGRIAKDFLASVLRETPSLSQLVSTELTSVATQLIRVSLQESLRQDTDLQPPEQMRARIQAYVERNLHDPDLTVAAIADEHHFSKRYLHKIFSCTGESIGQLILRTRLERCHRDLTQSDRSHLSITEIAFAWGFNSQGHFSHAFRKHFGISPSACREAARQVQAGL